MLTFQLTSTAILILSLINTAQAHYVWLEREGEGPAYAYFGEWVDDIREKAGGLLDRIKSPRAFLGASTSPLPIKRHEDKLEIEVKGKGDLRLVENSIPPRDDTEKGGKTRTIYYVKAGRSETSAKLDLELVPTVGEGNTLVLLFYGIPLTKTEVTVIGPPKWEKHLTTDDQGRIDMLTPWSGRYVWRLLISKRNRVAPKMTSSIAPVTLHHSLLCSGMGKRGPPNVNPKEAGMVVVQ